MWAFVTQKGMAMDNYYLIWLFAMKAATYRVKIATRQRNAAATYTNEQAMELEQSIRRMVQKTWIGSITVTAPCGCSFTFEKTESHVDAMCDTHWVGSVFNGDIDE
jgi:hypothetical protein